MTASWRSLGVEYRVATILNRVSEGSYPQAVDNFVDNQLNHLQNRVLKHGAIALRAGVR